MPRLAFAINKVYKIQHAEGCADNALVSMSKCQMLYFVVCDAVEMHTRNLYRNSKSILERLFSIARLGSQPAGQDNQREQPAGHCSSSCCICAWLQDNYGTRQPAGQDSQREQPAGQPQDNRRDNQRDDQPATTQHRCFCNIFHIRFHARFHIRTHV